MTTVEAVLGQYPGAETFTFGDNPDLCADLIARVRAGVKTATCGALRDFEIDGEALPIPGRVDIALNWDGTPALALLTLDVQHTRFCDVSEDFALAEGENDDLEGWRRDHRAFFERNGGWNETMMLVCERFEMVEDFS